MKSYQVILLVLLSLLTFSCVDNLADYGSAVQPTQDQITIGADTFHLNTQDFLIDSINSKPDSFLLGNFYNYKYGSTRADILAQVKCPLEFTFHDGSVPDSVLLVLYFKSWYGDANSPIEVNVYEMNKKTFDYSTLYFTNLNPNEYCDLSDPSMLLGQKIFTVKERVKTRPDSTSVQIKLSADFMQRLFNSKQYFSKDADFLNYIKGIFVTTKFGASTVLNIKQMDVELYYHYKYIDPITNQEQTVKTMFTFPANQEVRQVNRFFHDDRNVVVKHADSVNYVASPANIYTKINIPLKRVQSRIDKALGVNKMQLLDKAILKVNAVGVSDSAYAMPVVNYMLLIKESSLQNFFNNKGLPSDSSNVCVLGQFASTKNTTTGLYEYYYYYDVAKILENELKVAKRNKTDPAENLKMVLVPVSMGTSSSSSSTVFTSCKQQYKISGITIRSGKVIDPGSGNKVTEPMMLKLIYSGF